MRADAHADLIGFLRRLGCQLDNRSGLGGFERSVSWTTGITSLVCADFTQLAGSSTSTTWSRAVKASTPGQYTFIVPATGKFPDECCIPADVRSGFAFLIMWSLRRSSRGSVNPWCRPP